MQTIIDAWFVQGMIKATSDAWLKGWDERNGGNLTLRLDCLLYTSPSPRACS